MRDMYYFFDRSGTMSVAEWEHFATVCKEVAKSDPPMVAVNLDTSDQWSAVSIRPTPKGDTYVHLTDTP